MKNLFVWGISILTLIGCSNDDSDNDSELNIRLSNVSPFNYRNIVVNTTNFENIGPNRTTDYRTFQTAYRYAFVELEIEGKTYTIQPVDYVGETPLEKGNYTYQIDANDSRERYGKLSLTLIEE